MEINTTSDAITYKQIDMSPPPHPPLGEVEELLKPRAFDVKWPKPK